ncbi:protoporphyrinogen oxidase HemJ [Pikeienuella sp. HZG-20]|uniref:protoporphyrinogen oxidase HemJ n=1 Tax=Paludibacillus litoralis TaxID=3133267 RepID=UPI0030EBB262
MLEFIEDILIDLYPWTLVLHLISVISWMAGLLYLPRLFVYHVESANGNPETSLLFSKMEKKLLRMIMNPAMSATWVFGLMLIFTPGLVDWSDGWPWVKALMVLALTVLHHALALWRKDLELGRNRKSGRFFRLMNEAPAIMMIVIVSMVIARPF